MRVTVLHRGEPIGTADLSIEPPFALGTLEPFSAYDALRPVFREQSRAMRNYGFLPPGDGEVGGADAACDAAGQAAFARAAAVCRELEFRDAEGAVVPMKSIGISDWYERSEISVDAFLPDAGGGVPARIPRAPSGESNASSPPR
jgi:hypothetical protein